MGRREQAHRKFQERPGVLRVQGPYPGAGRPSWSGRGSEGSTAFLPSGVLTRSWLPACGSASHMKVSSQGESVMSLSPRDWELWAALQGHQTEERQGREVWGVEGGAKGGLLPLQNNPGEFPLSTEGWSQQ